MEIAPVKTQRDYRHTLKEIAGLMRAERARGGSLGCAGYVRGGLGAQSVSTRPASVTPARRNQRTTFIRAYTSSSFPLLKPLLGDEAVVGGPYMGGLHDLALTLIPTLDGTHDIVVIDPQIFRRNPMDRTNEFHAIGNLKSVNQTRDSFDPFRGYAILLGRQQRPCLVKCRRLGFLRALSRRRRPEGTRYPFLSKHAEVRSRKVRRCAS